MTDKRTRLLVVFFTGIILALAMSSLFAIVFLPDTPEPIHWPNLLVVPLVFWAYLGCALFLVWDNIVVFMQRFYDLAQEEAHFLLMRMLGIMINPRAIVALRVQDGRANPDGPPVLSKVGGPGYLSIAHNSAAVTSRLGRLHRVLGPDSHTLEPFERCWDVIDLRPQHRTLRVEFMTSDGIPAYCDAEIRFHVAGTTTPSVPGSQDTAMPSLPYTFSPEAVLKLATNKYVKSNEGTGKIVDWCVGLVNGALGGELRNHLEKYSLDDFLNPDYREASYRYAVGEAAEPPKKPLDLKNIEAEIEAKVKATGQQQGIEVEWVHLEPVRPLEALISRQWLEFWQARARRDIEVYKIAEDKRRDRMLDEVKIEAQIELITSILAEVHALAQKGIDVPSQLINLSFVDALRAMSERDSGVRLLMFQNTERLMRLISPGQQNNNPPVDAGAPSQPLPAS